LFTLRDGTLVAYCRSRQGQIVQTRSQDQGQSWTPPETVALPNPNSGLDGVTLADGRHALVYNHTQQGRTPLNLAIAADDGMNWQPALVLESEPGEYSYPAIIQTGDGLLHITYTWRRERIKHVVVNPR
jgi:predicted neuraminidase